MEVGADWDDFEDSKIPNTLKIVGGMVDAEGIEVPNDALSKVFNQTTIT